MHLHGLNPENPKARRLFAITAALLIVIGIAVRLIALGENPAGLNQDEASAGYEAYSLLRYGLDRNGQSFPVMFIAWGSGQNVLYSYLSIPFIAVFGLSPFSVRLPAALLGGITLIIFYFLGKRLRGERFALIALFLLVVNPWHIMISRWALESNLLPLMLLLGMYFLVISLDNKYFIIASAVCFGLSLYAYTTAFMFLPVFALLCLPYLIKNKKINKSYIPALAVFIIIALPIVCCLLINALGLPPLGKLLGLTLPVLTEGRQMKTTIFGSGDLLGSALSNFRNFLFLLADQSDGHAFNSIRPHGLYYFWGLPVSAFGVYLSVRRAIRREPGHEAVMLAALAACFVCSFFIYVNINRMNMIFLPLLYFNAVCIEWLCSLLKRRGAAVIAAAYLMAFCLFIGAYFTSYRERLSELFFEGFGDAVIAAEQQSGERGVTVTNNVNMPYIYVLFYNKTPVTEFIDSVEYFNPDGDFRWVRSFSKYSFGIDDEPDPRRVYIVSGAEKPLFESGFTLEQYGNYYVAVPE